MTVSNKSAKTHTLTDLTNGETYTISVVATSMYLVSKMVDSNMPVSLGKYIAIPIEKF